MTEVVGDSAGGTASGTTPTAPTTRTAGATAPTDATVVVGTTRILNMGIVGLGAAGRAFIPAINAHPKIALAAIAEADPAVRAAAPLEPGVARYASLTELLAHPRLDVVCVATPTPLHVAHSLECFAMGKHVLVEKPMAVNSADARAMIAAARQQGVQLVVGHSHSYDPPMQRMRDIIVGGTLGRVRMVNTWCYSDWMYRPRRPEELDVTQGGGVTFRQGSHQFDIIRLLCGARVRSVKARTFDWDPHRRSMGAHAVFIDFADGAAATAIYNGYGRFATAEICFGIGEWGFEQSASPGPPARRRTRPQVGADASESRSIDQQAVEDELEAKRLRAVAAIPANSPHPPFFGMTLVSCERGDLRQSRGGLYLYSDEGRSEIPVSTGRSPRDLVIAELHDAIMGTSPALHDGDWGLANLEICEAAIASSTTGREVWMDEHDVDARPLGATANPDTPRRTS